MAEAIYFSSSSEFRPWLDANHSTHAEIVDGASSIRCRPRTGAQRFSVSFLRNNRNPAMVGSKP